MSDNAREVFARNFSYLLEKRGKSQIDVARDLDVATGTVSSWANGQKYPRIDKVQRLADYLGVRMSILVEENGVEVFNREEEESRLLAAYRAASPDIREAALDILEKSAAKNQEKATHTENVAVS